MAKITIRDEKYRVRSFTKLKRKQARRVREIIDEMQSDNPSIDSAWDLLELVCPGLPEHVLDDMTLEECTAIIGGEEFEKAVSGAGVSLGE